jgi:hypothetical protein
LRLSVESLEQRALPALEGFGSVAGSIGVVQVVDSSDPNTIIRSFIPYNTNFIGGVRVAVGGVNTGDTSDPKPSQYLVTAPGPGGGPDIRVYDLTTGLLKFNINALDSAFRGGAFVAVGDVNGDGYDDIIVGAGAGGGPQVQVFSGQNGQMLSNFYAYPSSFSGGLSVAAGELTVGGPVDVVTGAGPSGGPVVNEFNGTNGSSIGSFMALNPAFRGGISIATVPDVSTVGLSDVVVGAGPGGGPQVQVFSSGNLIRSFFAGNNPDLTSGVNVASYVTLPTDMDYMPLQPGQVSDSQIVVGTDGTVSNIDVVNLYDLSTTNIPTPVLTVLSGLTAGVYVGADNSNVISAPPPPISLSPGSM